MQLLLKALALWSLYDTLKGEILLSCGHTPTTPCGLLVFSHTKTLPFMDLSISYTLGSHLGGFNTQTHDCLHHCQWSLAVPASATFQRLMDIALRPKGQDAVLSFSQLLQRTMVRHQGLALTDLSTKHYDVYTPHFTLTLRFKIKSTFWPLSGNVESVFIPLHCTFATGTNKYPTLFEWSQFGWLLCNQKTYIQLHVVLV